MWLARVALALVVAAGLVLFARVSSLAIGTGSARIELHEKAAEQPREGPAGR